MKVYQEVTRYSNGRKIDGITFRSYEDFKKYAEKQVNDGTFLKSSRDDVYYLVNLKGYVTNAMITYELRECSEKKKTIIKF